MILYAFQYGIRYKNTTEHGNFDLLSRLPLCNVDLPQQFNSVIDESEIHKIN